ncbi:two component transcriptional regulator, LuxR family [Actinobacteria bacterium OK074]|nr:two component transcriptional regulator, LuxR family [Actinobacteria bacterium OK074]
MIRVLLVEDMHVVRAGLAALLGGEFDMEIVAQAADAPQALLAVDRVRPDVALVDVDLPGADGVALVRELAVRAPRCRTVMLTALDRPGHVRRALDAGASGYLLKTVSARQLAEAVRRVATGGRAVEPAELAADASYGISPLTAAEAETLRLAASGAATKTIAVELFLAVGTVRNRLSSAAGKLQARSLVDAIRIAERYGWI